MKTLHGDFYEAISNEQIYKMQMKGEGEKDTEQAIWKNINPRKGYIEKNDLKTLTKQHINKCK